MKLRIKSVGIKSFLIVLFTMPLGHAAMKLMQIAFGEHIFIAAGALGFFGVFALILGIYSNKESVATYLGFFGALFVWTGWIEFAFVYYAQSLQVSPLTVGGEIVTKPEYLIMPSSIGFWGMFLAYYLLAYNSSCNFFAWIQKKLKLSERIAEKRTLKNSAVTTFMELNFLMWTFYLVLLIAYDNNFFGDRHPFTYALAFACLLWSMFLFKNLLKINDLAYAVRYAIPTVVIFWNFVEILGRWNLFHEIWVEPLKYWKEMSLAFSAFIILVASSFIKKNSSIRKIYSN
jgi:uncharacterized membrane protein (DUF485 family)